MAQAPNTKGVTSTEIKLALAEKHYKDFFLTEVKSGSSWMTPKGGLMILDALSIRKSWTNPCFTGYEIKVSRSDFLRDSKFYTYEVLVNNLYIVCPKGMIDRTELPESVGLMYYDPEKKSFTTRKKAIYRNIEYSSDLLLYIIFSRLESDRYPFFGSKEEYFREYVEGKRRCKDLAYSVKTKLVEDTARLEKELEGVQHFQKQRDSFLDVQKVAEKHNIWCGWDGSHLAEGLDEALSRKPTEDIVDIRQSLEGVVNRLKAMEEKAEEANDDA